MVHQKTDQVVWYVSFALCVLWLLSGDPLWEPFVVLVTCTAHFWNNKNR